MAKKNSWKPVAMPEWLWLAYKRRLQEFLAHRDSRPDVCWCPPGADLSDPAIWCMIAIDWHSSECRRKGLKSSYLIVTPDYEVLIMDEKKFVKLAKQCKEADEAIGIAEKKYEELVIEVGPELEEMIKTLEQMQPEAVPPEIVELRRHATSAVFWSKCFEPESV